MIIAWRIPELTERMRLATIRAAETARHARAGGAAAVALDGAIARGRIERGERPDSWVIRLRLAA